MNITGWNLAGDARVGNVTGSADSELVLVRNGLSNSGAIFYAQPINLSFCNKWIAEFDFRMYDGTGADGLAFCFLDVPPSAYVNGGGLGIPDVANGLKVCFDTWNNCIAFDTNTVHYLMPKIEIRYGKGYDQTDPNGNILTYGECNGQPTRDNSKGDMTYMRGPNYNRAKIEYDTGRISVYVNDTLYLTTYQPNLFNFTGYMGFTASTGGYDDTHSIKNVIIYTQMAPSYAGPPVAFCPQDSIRLGGPANPAYTYAWWPPVGLSDTTSSAPVLHLDNPTGDSALHKYFVRTAFADNPGCSSIDSVTVKTYPTPIVNYIMPKICLNDAVGQFFDSTYSPDAETLPFTYSWRFGDPNASPGNPDRSTLQNPTHRFSAAANYQMTLTVANRQGCIDSATRTFTVNGTNPVASFQVLNDSRLCSNQPVGLENFSTVDFGSVVAVRIDWGDSAGVSYTDSLPAPGKLYLHRYPNPVTANAASYTVRMIASSGYTCDNGSDQPVTLSPSPHVQFAAIPKQCEIDTMVNIANAGELAGLAGTAGFFGRGVTKEGMFDPLTAGAGMDTLAYAFAATDGCTDTAYQQVWVQALPRVWAGDDTAVVVGQPLQLQAVSNEDDDVFSWSPPGGLSDPGIATPVATLSDIDSVRYIVTATDPIGCFAQAAVRVVVFRTLPDLFVPNAFTPGRAANRVFRPVPVGISKLISFSVYNRMGQLVYSTSRIGEGWDGMVNGRRGASGVYVWAAEAVTYFGKEISKKGTVVLVE